MSTTIQRQTIELLTPALLAGAHQHQPEWRGASLHGQLHFWARVLAHDEDDPDKVRTGEARLTGGFLKQDGKLVPQAAPFAAWLEGDVESEPKEYPGCPHDHSKGWRNGIAAETGADLCWSRRNSAEWETDKPAANRKLEQDFAGLLRAWMLLGSLGLRANRAAGSVWIPGWSPTPEQFQQKVAALGLPACVEIRLLPLVSPAEFGAWVKSLRSLRYEERGHLAEQGIAEQLRAISTDTVGGRKGDITCNPLGYAGNGSERKASPVKLKVGRFFDGQRLIAVHDNRHGRGGRLSDVIDALLGREKLLGRLLRDSTVVSSSAGTTSAAAAVPGVSLDAAVVRLLAPPFKLSDFERYCSQVQVWLQARQLQTVADFIRATQAGQYRLMREKEWYLAASAAVASEAPPAISPPVVDPKPDTGFRTT